MRPGILSFPSRVLGLFVGLSLSFLGAAYAQVAPLAQPPNTPNPPTGSNVSSPGQSGNLLSLFRGRTPYEFWLICVIAAVSLTVIALLVFGVRRAHGYRVDDVTRPVIIVTVIMGTMVLVTAGYTNEQIAPAFGLFGTIVGYILGRFSQGQPVEPPPAPGAPAPPAKN